jgi:hypothetical protein
MPKPIEPNPMTATVRLGSAGEAKPFMEADLLLLRIHLAGCRHILAMLPNVLAFRIREIANVAMCTMV